MYGVRICSFHDADGEVTDSRGRVWRFEFSKMFGPTLVGKRGQVLENQTMTKAFWEAFYDWYEAKYGELEWRKAEREFAAEMASGKYVRIGNNIVPRTMVPADVLAELDREPQS